MQLLCFPFAGGNAHAYRGLEPHLPNDVRLTPVELPGRGRRAGEPLCRRMDALVELLLDELRPALTREYALFGHSMGASIAYTLARRIVATGLPPPQHLFVTGRAAPSVPEKRFRHRLPYDSFVAMLRELGGCPPDVLESDELMEFFEPILRADFELVETHFQGEALPLDVPIVAMIAERDDATLDEARLWENETTRGAIVRQFPGDHFFIFQQWPEVGRIISDSLSVAHPIGGRV